MRGGFRAGRSVVLSVSAVGRERSRSSFVRRSPSQVEEKPREMDDFRTNSANKAKGRSGRKPGFRYPPNVFFHVGTMKGEKNHEGTV